MEFKGKTIDDKPAADWPGIQKACAQHERFVIEVRDWDDERELSMQQIRWFKGILLPSLSKDNGDSIECWETTLKLAVMPDEFAPLSVKIGGHTIYYVPSITKLSVKQMSQLIEGSVAKLHEWGFGWITLPDKELRKS